MKIVYIAGEEASKPKRLTKKQKDMASACRWVAIQNEANYCKCLIILADEIKAIQEVYPGWLPKRANSLQPSDLM